MSTITVLCSITFITPGVISLHILKTIISFMSSWLRRMCSGVYWENCSLKQLRSNWSMFYSSFLRESKKNFSPHLTSPIICLFISFSFTLLLKNIPAAMKARPLTTIYKYTWGAWSNKTYPPPLFSVTLHVLLLRWTRGQLRERRVVRSGSEMEVEAHYGFLPTGRQHLYGHPHHQPAGLHKDFWPFCSLLSWLLIALFFLWFYCSVIFCCVFYMFTRNFCAYRPFSSLNDSCSWVLSPVWFLECFLLSDFLSFWCLSWLLGSENRAAYVWSLANRITKFFRGFCVGLFR